MAGGAHELHRRGIQAARPLQQVLTGRRQRHAVAMTEKECHAELALQLVDVAGERRLRDVQPLGGLRDAQRICDRNERADVSEVHGRGVYTESVFLHGQTWYWTEFGRRRSVSHAEATPQGGCGRQGGKDAWM